MAFILPQKSKRQPAKKDDQGNNPKLSGTYYHVSNTPFLDDLFRDHTGSRQTL